MVAHQFDAPIYRVMKLTFPKIRKNYTGFNYKDFKSLYNQTTIFINKENIKIEGSGFQLPAYFKPVKKVYQAQTLMDLLW